MFRDHEFTENLKLNISSITSFQLLENKILSWKNSRVEIRGEGAEKIVKN